MRYLYVNAYSDLGFKEEELKQNRKQSNRRQSRSKLGDEAHQGKTNCEAEEETRGIAKTKAKDKAEKSQK